jgi:putative spermidine/putrescine transport system ATP-binding protein
MTQNVLLSEVESAICDPQFARNGDEDIALRIEKLCKRYPGAKDWSVKEFNLEVRRGSLVALLGPSGCGKTTTLRMIAGLIEPTEGEIYLEKKKLRSVPAHRRNIGLVFQHYALFPLLNVFENVAYGLRERRATALEIQQRVGEALSMVQLSDLARRKPKELSGGQQQRVALARALVIKPSLLLLDEPLSNLDAKLRQQVRSDIKRLQEKLGITTLFVTHDQEEALSLAQTVVVMRNGTIEQSGRPQEIYQQPDSAFVANFVGSCNFVTAVAHRREAGTLRCVVNGTALELDIPDDIGAALGTQLSLAARPERLELTSGHQSVGESWPGTVSDATYLGAVTSYDIEVAPSVRLIATVVNRGSPAFGKGSKVRVSWAEGAWRLLR